MSESSRWIVTTSGDRLFSDIQNDLADTGFEIDQTLSEIGIIIGSGDDDAAEKLRSIPGVTDVSPEEPIDIGPPDAPVTW